MRKCQPREVALRYLIIGDSCSLLSLALLLQYYCLAGGYHIIITLVRTREARKFYTREVQEGRADPPSEPL